MGCKTVVDIKYHFYDKTELFSLKKLKENVSLFYDQKKNNIGQDHILYWHTPEQLFGCRKRSAGIGPIWGETSRSGRLPKQ